MKILFSAYACNPGGGGEVGNGFNWAYHTAKAGNQVWCLASVKGKTEIENFLKSAPFSIASNLNFIFVDVPTVFNKLKKYQFGVYLHYLSWQYQAYLAAKELNQRHNFEIIHHVTWGSLQLGSWLWKLDKPLLYGPVGGGQLAPKVFKKYFYGWWRSEIIRDHISNLFKNYTATKKTLQRADIVFVTNQETYEMAEKMNAKNIKYSLDTGLPDEFYPETIPERKGNKTLKILWVGRLFARKGLPLVLEALSKVNSDIPFTLTILGNGPMGTMLPEMIKNYNLEGKVEWKGQVPWDEVKNAYMTHNLFMFCSLRDSFASQFLEAMACGLPIISLNHHGAAKFIPEDAGIKVNVTTSENTIENLAAAVEWMFKNPDERMEMGLNGHRFAKKHTWTEKVQEMEIHYNSLMPELV